MGNQCGAKNSESDPATGLTKQDKKYITEMWVIILAKATFKENGTLFFIKLFKMYPYIQEYFQDFANQSEQELKNSTALRAHGISVFTSITTYVDCLDDAPTLVALIHKRSVSHYRRAVTFEDMENLKIVLLEFLKEHSKGYKNADKALEAWGKLLTVHNAVYQAKINQLAEASAKYMSG